MLAPSPEATFERALSLCNEACFAVALQRRRLRTPEPEDGEFRWWADLQFLIVALRRLRTAARLATHVPIIQAEIAAAIDAFDKALPNLKMMRDIGEHIDDYALDRGRKRSVTRQGLQVGSWDGETFTWAAGGTIAIDDALRAAEQLFNAMRAAKERVLDARKSSVEIKGDMATISLRLQDDT